MKIAILSNTNMDYIVRILAKETDVLQPEGYGNVLGTMFNPASAYNRYSPQMAFLFLDLWELLEHECAYEAAQEKLDQWFSDLRNSIHGDVIYYISDAFLAGDEVEVIQKPLWKSRMEMLWNRHLLHLAEEYSNVRVFPYAGLIQRIGTEKAFSRKQWYMGKMLFSMQAQKRIADEILHKIEIEKRTPKKVLLLDLDGTLWGGLAGEHELTPIELSDDHLGLVYKNTQRMIKQMQEQGVLLAIVSKNNETDVSPILQGHPHMVLREEDFVSRKINWEQKHINIQEIAEELNLGLDSFVFWDDNPTERELVRQMLPAVAVPDFPERVEDMPEAVRVVYRTYFERSYLTQEDRNKTGQYIEQNQRKQLQKQSLSFSDYLKKLQIKITRIDADKCSERLHQLINKTNQFNLTTRRYTQQELEAILGDETMRVYAYRVADCFGDYGITAVLIVNLRQEPVVEEFAMSCRIMGKQIENAILESVERELFAEHYETLLGIYIPTAKNKPVETLYPSLGYQKLEESGEQISYSIDLRNVPERHYEAELQVSMADAAMAPGK